MTQAEFLSELGMRAEAVAQELCEESDLTGRRLIIECLGEPVGEMSYRNLGEDTAEIGVKLWKESERDKGIGTACLRLLIGELFSQGYRYMVLDANKKNLRAQHVYEKLGFKKVAVQENAWVDRLGEPQTAVCYALKRKDFNGG